MGVDAGVDVEGGTPEEVMAVSSISFVEGTLCCVFLPLNVVPEGLPGGRRMNTSIWSLHQAPCCRSMLFVVFMLVDGLW